MNKTDELRDQLEEIEKDLSEITNKKAKVLQELEKIESKCKHKWFYKCEICGRIEHSPSILSLEL